MDDFQPQLDADAKQRKRNALHRELFRLENELTELEDLLRRAARAEEDMQWVKAAIARNEAELEMLKD